MKASLPIDACLDDLTPALDRCGAVVLVAETGAGKTTRVPPFLSARHPGRRVIVLEPRRIAARAAARRMAEEEGSRLGERIGFSTRFERAVSRGTEIEVVTEGLFLRRVQEDPELNGVAAVVLDEFHERSINLDLSLAFLKELRSSLRPDLEIVVMSATITPEPVAGYLGEAEILRSAGRSFPIEIIHDRQQSLDELEPRVVTAVREELHESAGHLLVFLPGMGEILRCQRLLADLEADPALRLLRLHGELAADEQDAVFREDGRRKIVLATNIAETSLTIPGVRVVIDSGRARVLRHDPDLGLDRLELQRISRASADQRAGRAGREAPGRARRLWTLADERAMPEVEEPEIRRVDLSRALLEVMNWGARHPQNFAWFEAPEEQALRSSLDLLQALGAVEQRSSGLGLTGSGRRMAMIPAPVRIAAMLLAAEAAGLGKRAALAAALLVERDPLPFGARRDLASKLEARSDLLLRMDLVEAGDRGLDRRGLQTIRRLADQFARMMRLEARGDASATADEDLLRCLVHGFPDRVARMRAGSRRAVMCGGRGLVLREESILGGDDLFLALRLEAGRRGQGAESPVAWASAIEESWLDELPEGGVKEVESARFDEAGGKVKTYRQRRYRDLVLDERVVTGGGDAGAIEAELVRVLRERPELARRLLENEALKRYRGRIRLLATAMPELDLPAVDDAGLLEILVESVPGCRGLSDLAAIDLVAALEARLGWARAQEIKELAPERIALPGGRSAALHYEADRVLLRARVQHLFGVLETPKIAGGRIAVVVELLAPNQRPVQVTADLGGFWRTSYQLVRKDLRGRYPKHDWPEVPPGL